MIAGADAHHAGEDRGFGLPVGVQRRLAVQLDAARLKPAELRMKSHERQIARREASVIPTERPRVSDGTRQRTRPVPPRKQGVILIVRLRERMCRQQKCGCEEDGTHIDRMISRPSRQLSEYVRAESATKREQNEAEIRPRFVLTSFEVARDNYLS